MLASVTMCNDDISNYNSKISDLGYLTIIWHSVTNHSLYMMYEMTIAVSNKRIPE